MCRLAVVVDAVGCNTAVTAIQTTLTTDAEQTLPGRQSSPSVGRAVIRLSDN
jgi:hypothetical protein